MKVLFFFGDIVVVEGNLIGVVVKSWTNGPYFKHDVYVRNFNKVVEYPQSKIERYKVRHKELNDEEMEYQNA